MEKFRKGISAPGLVKLVRKRFEKIEDKKNRRGKNRINLADCLMSGMAIFGLKYASLLQFEEQMRHRDSGNLESLYQVKRVPSDTYFREELDEVNPEDVLGAFTDIFREVQRGKGLERYTYLNGAYLVAIDGTGYFHSNEVHCKSCCEKHHRDGTVSYYHQMLGAAIVHPNHKEVIALGPEPIIKEDGDKKNDCERNAAKRLIARLVKEHPKLPMIVIEDALYGNDPHIQLLKEHGLSYIIGVKPADHTFLFDWVKKSERQRFEFKDEKGIIHRFEWVSNVPLNESHLETNVNFLEYWEIGKTTQHFTWITDLKLSKKTVQAVMRGGRARWKIENETFNTLKNQGYQFEHNFGHGKKHLSTVLAYLMMLAFLIDQIQAFSCDLFKNALLACHNKKSALWRRMRSAFFEFNIPSWESLYTHIVGKHPRPPLPHLNST